MTSLAALRLQGTILAAPAHGEAAIYKSGQTNPQRATTVYFCEAPFSTNIEMFTSNKHVI
jgi:hypothetical protein